jgi:hypothetical protein
VTACRRDLERAPGSVLPAHVGQVHARGAEHRRVRGRIAGAVEGRARLEVGGDLAEVIRHAHLDAGHRGGLGGVLSRHDGARDPAGHRAAQRREHAPYRSQRAGEGELTEQRGPFEGVRRDLAQRAEGGDGDGDVEGAAALLEIGGAEVHGDHVLREVDPDLLERGAHADAALARARLGEAHEVEVGGAAARVDLDADGVRVETDQREGERRGLHARPLREGRAASGTARMRGFGAIPGGAARFGVAPASSRREQRRWGDGDR